MQNERSNCESMDSFMVRLLDGKIEKRLKLPLNIYHSGNFKFVKFPLKRYNRQKTLPTIPEE